MQVIQNVYPIGTYSWTTQLVFSFLLTDLLRSVAFPAIKCSLAPTAIHNLLIFLPRYKPLIILSGVAGIAIWSMLLWST